MSLDHPLSQYASLAMQEAWSMDEQVKLERELWVEILGWLWDNTDNYAHVTDMGGKFSAYAEAVHWVDLASIKDRERIIKHDVKARIEEFNHQASLAYKRYIGEWERLELIHWGLTSADIVDNISLIRMLDATQKLLGYTSNPDVQVPLQRIESSLKFRGLKGPVGTQQDLLDLIGDSTKVQDLDRYLASYYGFSGVLNSVGQVYPRSMDGMVTSNLCLAVQRCSCRYPWHTILSGYNRMVVSYSGSQWNEGDVSTSVIRRVALPGAFLATDAALRGVQP